VWILTIWQTDQARNPVRFDQAAKTLIEDKGFNVVIDVGPQPFVWTALQNSGDHEHLHLLAACAKQGKDQDAAFLGCLASLFELGVTPNLSILYDKAGYSKVRLPTYPWQRERHYPNFIPSRRKMSPVNGALPTTPLSQPNGHTEPLPNGKHSDVQPTQDSHSIATAKHLDLLNIHLTAAENRPVSKKSQADVESFVVSCIKEVLEFGADKELGAIMSPFLHISYLPCV
jgi:acyl transferase domain-containing protein